MARRGGGAQIVTIYWRDIPAQVNGQVGRERHQVILSAKFQRAIDRAKRKAGIYTAEDDIAQWRRQSVACEGDVAEAAESAANRLEVAMSREFLGRLAYAAGFEADIEGSEVDRFELLALEELDEADGAPPPDDARDDDQEVDHDPDHDPDHDAATDRRVGRSGAATEETT